MKTRTSEALHELKHHSPFTILATIMAIILITLLYFFKISDFNSIMQTSFHIAHPLHLFVSAIASAAIFYKYKKSFFQAILVGLLGAIVIGSISDVLFPYLIGIIFNMKLEFHLPIIENPLLILSVAIIGSILGIKTKLTKVPHLLHVFLSVFASLLYLFAFNQTITPLTFILSALIVFIAVIVPCCLSDILFPFFFLGKKIKHCDC
jgi:predicted membrane protein